MIQTTLTKNQILLGKVKENWVYILMPFIIIYLLLDKIFKFYENPIFKYFTYKDIVRISSCRDKSTYKIVRKAKSTDLHKDYFRWAKSRFLNIYVAENTNKQLRILVSYDKLKKGHSYSLVGNRMSDWNCTKVGRLKGNKLREFLAKNNITKLEQYYTDIVIFVAIPQNYDEVNEYFHYKYKIGKYNYTKNAIDKAIAKDCYILTKGSKETFLSHIGYIVYKKQYELFLTIINNELLNDVIFKVFTKDIHKLNTSADYTDYAINKNKEHIKDFIDNIPTEYLENQKVLLFVNDLKSSGV